MIIEFETRSNSQLITVEELNLFEQGLGKKLPEDYNIHMLKYNGGDVIDEDIQHKNFDNPDTGLSYLFPIKYGNFTIEKANEDSSKLWSSDYLSIGKNVGGGYIIMSLNNDETYGEIKEWYPDGELNYMSPSFSQYLDDMIESDE